MHVHWEPPKGTTQSHRAFSSPQWAGQSTLTWPPHSTRPLPGGPRRELGPSPSPQALAQVRCSPPELSLQGSILAAGSHPEEHGIWMAASDEASILF